MLIAEDVYYPGDEEPDEFYFQSYLTKYFKVYGNYSKQGGMDKASCRGHLI